MHYLIFAKQKYFQDFRLPHSSATTISVMSGSENHFWCSVPETQTTMDANGNEVYLEVNGGPIVGEFAIAAL